MTCPDLLLSGISLLSSPVLVPSSLVLSCPFLCLPVLHYLILSYLISSYFVFFGLISSCSIYLILCCLILLHLLLFFIGLSYSILLYNIQIFSSCPITFALTQGDNLAELWLNFLLLESDQEGGEKEKMNKEKDNLISGNDILSSPKGLGPFPSPSPKNVSSGLISPVGPKDATNSNAPSNGNINVNAFKQPMRSFSFTNSKSTVKEDSGVFPIGSKNTNT